MSDPYAARLAVEDAVTRMFVATDDRDWPTVEASFTDPFRLDMTSLVGGAPADLTPQQIAATWDAGFRPLDVVHHQIGNLRTTVDGARARLRCYGIALHHRAQVATGERTRMFVGSYDFELVARDGDWKISAMTFLCKLMEGNTDLEQAPIVS